MTTFFGAQRRPTLAGATLQLPSAAAKPDGRQISSSAAVVRFSRMPYASILSSLLSRTLCPSGFSPTCLERECLRLFFHFKQNKKVITDYSVMTFFGAQRRPTLAGGDPQLPSALKSLTSVFGMGTGVTSSPSSLDFFGFQYTSHCVVNFVRSISHVRKYVPSFTHSFPSTACALKPSELFTQNWIKDIINRNKQFG